MLSLRDLWTKTRIFVVFFVICVNIFFFSITFSKFHKIPLKIHMIESFLCFKPTTFWSSHWKCSIKKVFLKILDLRAPACNFFNKETLAQGFSCEFYESFKNTSGRLLLNFIKEMLLCICFLESFAKKVWSRYSFYNNSTRLFQEVSLQVASDLLYIYFFGLIFLTYNIS